MGGCLSGSPPHHLAPESPKTPNKDGRSSGLINIPSGSLHLPKNGPAFMQATSTSDLPSTVSVDDEDEFRYVGQNGPPPTRIGSDVALVESGQNPETDPEPAADTPADQEDLYAQDYPEYEPTYEFVECGVKSTAGFHNGKAKTNQDAYFILDNFGPRCDMQFYGVCDGHGLIGEQVSQYVTEHLPKWLTTTLQERLLPGSSSDPMCDPSELAPLSEDEQKGYAARLKADDDISKAIEDAFQRTVDGLFESSVDCDYSGTTCSCALRVADRLFIANVGDSRTMLCRVTTHFSRERLDSVQLTNDHSPDVPAEADRIRSSGGNIAMDSDGNSRVEVVVEASGPNLHARRVTTAVSRSMGDGVVAKFGVISEPEIKVHVLTDSDRFIVWASDGIWTMMDNREVGVMVWNHITRRGEDLNTVAQRMVSHCSVVWKDESPDYIDDITFLIAQIDYAVTEEYYEDEQYES